MAVDGPLLAVAPAMVHDMDTWSDEIKLWRPDLDWTPVSYHRVVHRDRVVSEETGRVGMRFTDKLAEPLRREWGAVAFDEAHNIKSRDTHWTKASARIRADRVILMTGTPIPNWAHELFVPLRLLRPEEARPGGELGSYWRWIGRWFNITQKTARNGRVLTDHFVDGSLRACQPECDEISTPGGCEHWERFRRENLGDLWIRRLRDDILTDLPPLIGFDQLHKVSMTKEQARAYKTLRSEFLVTLESGEDIAAWNTAGLLTRLRQVATGLDVLTSVEESGKLDALEQLVAGRSRPTLVLGHYHGTLDAIERRLDKLDISWVEVSGRRRSTAARRQARDLFNAGQVDVLVGQVEVIAEGLNLQHAGDMVVFVEHSWRPDKNEQAVRRLHRPGQQRPVTVVRLTTRGTVDTEMIELLKNKTAHQVRAMPARAWRAIV